jgi:phosphohistidine phosphatase SixA
MPRFILYLLILTFSSCGSVKYYVVRHAEKATPSEGAAMNTPNDPPLSAAGRGRAIELREALKGKGIRYIFSTNTIRTIATAQPLNELRGATHIELYNTKDSLDHLIDKLKAINKGNSLIVGHSNTVDDIVNKLCGEKLISGDLPDSEYDNLYIVTKKGKQYRFENKTYGTVTN